MTDMMSSDPAVKRCPSVEQLEQAAAGDEPGDAVRAHVRRCASCARAWSVIHADNALLTELVSAGPEGTASAGARPELPGYEVLGEIRRGGQGVVYKGVQRATRRPVAIKMLVAGSFATSSQRRRFEREAEIAASLRHPNIVAVYESGRTAGGHHYLAMEYVDGVPLDEYARTIPVGEPRGVRRALELFSAICDGVAAAHRRGVIHRDLKPSNILVDAEGTPRVLDFGLARDAAPGRATGAGCSRTAEGVFHGTLAYAAPEQVSGRPDAVDVRADVYALGAILYELLTGAPAHPAPEGPGVAPVAEMIRKIERDPPPDPGSLNRTLDADVRTIVTTAMATDASRRYQSATALLEDVRHYLAGEAINARRDSQWYVFRKVLARRKAATGAVLSAAVLLVAFSVVMTVLYRRAVAAEEAARAREGELQLVAEFQAAQLGAIDVAAMGAGLRADILARSADALARRGAGPDGVKLSQLEDALAGVNFTDAALHLLEAGIFEGALSEIDARFSAQPLVKARLLQAMADTLRALGLRERAEAPQAEALAIRGAELGARHHQTLASMHAMGVLLEGLGRPADAEALLREALDGRRRAYGALHPDTLDSMRSLGGVLMRQSKLDEAGECLRAALAGDERVHGEKHAATLTSMNLLAGVLLGEGDSEEAERLARAALEGRRETLGDNAPDTLHSCNYLGVILQSQGRPAQAEALYREALRGFESVFGEHHPETLRVMTNLAYALQECGDPDAAGEHYRRALALRRRTLGDLHPDTLVSINGLGVLLRELGELEEAERLGSEAVRGARSALPPDHWLTGAFLSHHGRTLAAMGRFGEAEGQLLEAHDLLTKTFEPGHARVKTNALALAELYSAWSRQDPGDSPDADASLWRDLAGGTAR